MMPPSTPTRTVRPVSVLFAPPLPPVPLWISPFKGLVVSLLIVRFLSTRVYPILPAGITRLARLFARSRPLRLAHEPDRAAVLLGDLLDRELGGRDDRAHVLAVAGFLGPAHQQVAAAPVAGHRHAGDVGQTDPGRLQQRRNRGAGDVLTRLALPRVAAGKNGGQPVAAVPAKTNLEHRPRRARSCRSGPRRSAGGGRSACGRASSACT